MPRTCETCESPVSRQFARVFGDNEGRIHACPACVSMSTVARGAGAGLAVEKPNG